MNSVLLGFVDSLLTENEMNEFSYTDTKIGGTAIGPSKSVFSIDKPLCKLCGLKVPLLIQLYAPLSGSQYHRTLYIYACINLQCQNNSRSWICLRRQCKVEDINVGQDEEYEESNNNFTWFDDQDEWPENDNETEKVSNSFSARLYKDTSIEPTDQISCSSEPKSDIERTDNTIVNAEIEDIDNVQPLDDFYLRMMKKDHKFSPVDFESVEFKVFNVISVTEDMQPDVFNSEENKRLLAHHLGNSKIVLSNNVTDGILSSENNEIYEKCLPKHGMKLVYSFLKRIKRNPEQILRYCRNNAAPLFLYEETKIPNKCNYCNGELIFEIQILPSIIKYLKLTTSDIDLYEMMDFGSAFIYTCENSCWMETDVFKEECVIVQKEYLF